MEFASGAPAASGGSGAGSASRRDAHRWMGVRPCRVRQSGGAERRVPVCSGSAGGPARWHREHLSPPRLRPGRRGDAPRPPSRGQGRGAWAARAPRRVVPVVPVSAGGQKRTHPTQQQRLTWRNRPGTWVRGVCVCVGTPGGEPKNLVCLCRKCGFRAGIMSFHYAGLAVPAPGPFGNPSFSRGSDCESF